MAKSAKKPEPAVEQVFDVAISFLVADERVASTIKSKLAGLNVFFYPHNQEELIGTNGLESMRAPFLTARLNVVLYRERYGKTPWTGVELAAIQDSCLKTAYRSLLFVQLDKKDPGFGLDDPTGFRRVLQGETGSTAVGRAGTGYRCERWWKRRKTSAFGRLKSLQRLRCLPQRRRV